MKKLTKKELEDLLNQQNFMKINEKYNLILLFAINFIKFITIL